MPGTGPGMTTKTSVRTSEPSIQHAERMHVGRHDRLGFLSLIDVLLAQPHDLTQRLDVEARALGLGVDVADIFGNRLLLFFQPLDALDEGLELVPPEADRGLFFVGSGSSGRHRSLLHSRNMRLEGEGRESGRGVKRGRGHPQRPMCAVDNQCLWLDFSNAAFCSVEASFWYFAFHSSNGMP